MKELFHIAISKLESIKPQITKLLQATQNLKFIAFELVDKVLAFIIVMALLESMSTFKTILYNTWGMDLTCNRIIYQILINEQRCIQTLRLKCTAFYFKAVKATKKPNEKSSKHCTHCNF